MASPLVPGAMDPDPAEAAARINAAAAYANMSRVDMAAALEISPATYDRMAGKRNTTARGATWSELQRVAEVTGLPYAFFSADWVRLPEIAPPEAPLPADDPGELAIRLTHSAAQRAARRRASRQRRATRTRRAGDAEDAAH